MKVTVRYFAAAAEAAGREEEQLDFADTATLGDLKASLGQSYGADMDRVMASGSFLIDQVVQRDPGAALSAAVDVLPPFAGG